MMDNLHMADNETEEEFIYRICSNKEAIGSWIDVANVLNNELNHNFTESKYRKDFSSFNKMFEGNKNKFVNNNYVKSIEDERRELYKERCKLQTEKLEYNRWLRENARDDLIFEKLNNAIESLTPLNIPECKRYSGSFDKEYVLMFGDEHYGSEFTIFGLDGEIINSYSPEIFEQRMWKLLDKTIEIIEKNNIGKIHVFSMGDFTDGVLRVGQLMKLRYGVVDGTVKYMEFISNWLNELTRFVDVSFYMVNGNHSELRFFSQPKGAFKNENMGKVVSSYIKARLCKNDNFHFIENPTENIYANISGYNVLGVHGEMRDMEKAIRDFSDIYNKQIDFLVGGHLHHEEFKTTGINKGVLRVPSIIGVDDFSMSLYRSSCSGAVLVEFTENEGKTAEYSINLQ